MIYIYQVTSAGRLRPRHQQDVAKQWKLLDEILNLLRHLKNAVCLLYMYYRRVLVINLFIAWAFFKNKVTENSTSSTKIHSHYFN